MPEIEVTAMTFGPYALARLDGETIMVPNAAPGDRLEVSVASRRRDFSIGTIQRVLAAGPQRRVPPCPYLPDFDSAPPYCGGCDWQQLAYSAQLRAKSELIAAGLRRFVELDPANLVEPAPAEFGYRSRIRLKVARDGRIGFYQLGTNALVEIERCLVAAPGIVFPRALARALAPNLEELEVVSAGACAVVVGRMRKPPSSAEIQRAENIVREDAALKGGVLRSGRIRHIIGDPSVTIAIEAGLELSADADLFSQVNQAQNRKLVAAVMEMAAIERGTELLDLFCGAGNLSFPAARRGAKVSGVDWDDLATAAAARNAEALGLAQAKFIAGKALDTAHFLLRARYRPGVVILDPPRTGAFDLMEPILKMQPRSIIYVSCDISTLARDLRTLIAGGYRAARVRAFDFFPNTHHAEIAAHLLLT